MRCGVEAPRLRPVPHRVAERAKELTLGKGLDQPFDDAIAARAMIEGGLHAREHDHRHLLEPRRLTHVIHQIEAAAIGELHVEKDHRRPPNGYRASRFLERRRARHRVAGAGENDPDNARDGVVVLDDENAGRLVGRGTRVANARRGNERQLEPELAPLSRRGLDADAAALLLHERARDREPESRAASAPRVRRLQLLEAREEPRLLSALIP